MVVILENNVNEKQLEIIIEKLKGFGFDVHLSKGVQRQ